MSFIGFSGRSPCNFCILANKRDDDYWEGKYVWT